MRLVLLLPVLISVAVPAHAEGARESRYGPTTPLQATSAAAAAARYDGPMLGWSNKRQPSAVAPAAPTATVPVRPAPLAAWAGYGAAPSPPRTPPPAASVPPAPTSLYSQPRAAPPTGAAPTPKPTPPAVAASASARDWSSYRSDRMANPAPASAVPPPPVAPAPTRTVAAADGRATGARYYSVGRDYGLTPDPTPPVGPDTRVLVTTTEPPPEAKDAVPMHGSADWLAAGARGDDDEDDSAARRAKTRNQGL